MLIRPATDGDLAAVSDIYAHEAATGIATFDSEPRALEAWRAHASSTEAGDHLLVAAHTREASVYLSDAARGRGCGRLLYDALLSALRTDGVHLVVAVIALPNDASVALHRAFGFTSVGVLHEVGRKFGRWIDTELFELRLG